MSASLCARGNVNAKAGRGFAGRSTDETKFSGQGVSEVVVAGDDALFFGRKFAKKGLLDDLVEIASGGEE